MTPGEQPGARPAVVVQVPEDADHFDIVAAIAALPWIPRQALIAAALCQWNLDYKGDPDFVRVGKPAAEQPRRRKTDR